MKARHEPSQAFELFRRQFRLESPRTLRKEGEHHFVNFENTLSPVVRERADDGNCACFEGLQKIVLGLNGGAAPSAGAQKYDYDLRPLCQLYVVNSDILAMETR